MNGPSSVVGTLWGPNGPSDRNGPPSSGPYGPNGSNGRPSGLHGPYGPNGLPSVPNGQRGRPSDPNGPNGSDALSSGLNGSRGPNGRPSDSIGHNGLYGPNGPFDSIGPSGLTGPYALLEQQIDLIRDSLEFALRWLGWRKWLRASGLLEWAQGTDNQCLVPVVARQSTERRRQVVKQLDEEWCQINSRVLRSNPAIIVADNRTVSSTGYKLFPLSIVQNSIPNPDLLTFVTLILNNLYSQGLWFDVTHNETSRNVQLSDEPSHVDLITVVSNSLSNIETATADLDTYNFDSIVRNMNDLLVESMLRALSNCLMERNETCTIYAHEPEKCATMPTQLGMSECIILPLSISIGAAVNGKNNATTINLFVRGGHGANVSRFLNEYNDTVETRDLPGTNCRVLTLRRNEPEDVPLDDDELPVLIYDHFSPLLIQRTEIRYMLNTGVVALTLTDRALLIARLLNSRVTRDDALRTDSRVSLLFLRAMQLKRLALYRLDYESTPSSKSDEWTVSANTTDNGTLSQLKQTYETLQKMNVADNSYITSNGIERTNALLSAVFDLSHMRRRNVNKIWLHRATWCDSFAGLTTTNKVTMVTSNNDRMFSLVLIPTSALFDSEIVRSSLVVRNSCDTIAGDLHSGLYFRHSKYREIGVVLLPSDATPVFDRSVRVPKTADNSTETSTGLSSKYLRMCVVFGFDNVRRDAEWFKFFSEPIGIVVILYDIVSHLFPGEIDRVLRGNEEGGTLNGNDGKNDSSSSSFAARSRLLLGSVLRVDPFYSRSVPVEHTDSWFPHFTSIGSSKDSVAGVRRYLFKGNKLWQILRAGHTKAAFVRSNTSYYCPLLASLGVRTRMKGIVPLETTTVSNDTWKLYVYDSVSLGAMDGVTCDTVVRGSAIPSVAVSSGCYPLENDATKFDRTDGTTGTLRTRGQTFLDRIGEPDNVVRLLDPPLLALKNDIGRAKEQEWLIYESSGIRSFDNLVSLFHLPIESLVNVPVVRLIGWYVDHFDPLNVESPRLQKILSKRVYLINGILCICEYPVKFVGNSDESCRISKFRGSVALCNFADAYVKPFVTSGSSPCFYNDISDIDDDRVQVGEEHFYNRVFRNMYRFDRVHGGVSFRQIGNFYVLTFRCARLWFPMARLLLETKSSPDRTICYGDAPRQIVPLVDYYVRQALAPVIYNR